LVKISISVKYPDVKCISPVRLIDKMTVDTKKMVIEEINSVFDNIKRWAKVERNYYT
jgi:hypothetical protein